MYSSFLRSELKYTIKQPMVYLFFLIVFILSFAATSSDNVTIGGSIGNVKRNAPHIISVFTSTLTIFGLLFAAAFFNNAALRDFKYNFHEILFATPIEKFGYFFGRFTGALIISTIPILGVFLGITLGSSLSPFFGWISEDRFGPIQLQSFISNYFVFILPNMFISGTIIYALAQRFKNSIVSFVGALIIIVAYSVSGELVSDLENENLAALADIFGIRTYGLISKYYTAVDKNSINPSYSGLMLLNRVIWLSLSLVILITSYFNFSFVKKNIGGLVNIKATKTENKKNLTLPVISEKRGSLATQFLTFFSINLKNIYRHVTFKILFLFSFILLLTDLISGYEYYGLKSYPLTYRMIDSISGTYLFVIITLVFFSGELIWRDRDEKINEVVDSTPHNSIISLLSKTVSLFSLTIILHAFFVICAILFQIVKGFTDIQLEVYFWDFVYEAMPIYLYVCTTLIAVQVIVNNKYFGYLISVVLLLLIDIILLLADIKSNMLSFGETPYMIYSDMNGFGPSEKGVFWFNLYWIFTGLTILIFSSNLWDRGTNNKFKDRFKFQKENLSKKVLIPSILVGVCWFLITGYVYYNTQILNPYKKNKELEKIAVEYENKYKKYKSLVLPKILSVNYKIDLNPYKKKVDVLAEIIMTNSKKAEIDTLIVGTRKQWQEKITFEGASLLSEDKKHDVQFYLFNPPLKFGDTIKAVIENKFETTGFSNSGESTGIVKNGSFLNNYEILPSLGYSSEKELSDRNKRKKYKLPKKERMPKLKSNCKDDCTKNYLTQGLSDFINVETIISTSKDQIAIAPGSLIDNWEENNRNYFKYKVDHPSQNFYSFISADYKVERKKWNDVDIEIYYDKKHSINIDKMVNAVERSLDYYTKNFGPYTHKQCRIIEFPRFSTFAQAFPGTMPYSEAFGFVIDLEDEEKNNVIDAVIAHEIAHQWWAHQLVGANMQGATLLSESFSEYSSLMTMKSISKTPMAMREFIKYDHDRYLRGRSGEVEKELPLFKVENQSYIHYGKGSVILYALQDYIGEDNVNEALKEFLDKYKYSNYYPTSLDFLNVLEKKVPDSLNYLIDDWFKEITIYDNRLKTAEAKKLENGKYEINLELESKKIRADSIGNEKSVPLNEWVDIGFFTDKDEKELIGQKRIKIAQNKTNISFQLDSLPLKAAIDPRHLLIDKVYSDNIKTVNLN